MSVAVLAFGLNHTSAPVSVRERVSMPVDLVRPALDGLRSAFGGSVREAAILSTCNRTEIYCAADGHVAEQLPAWLADYNRLDAGTLRPHLYRHHQDDAVRHAFRVASGLDSMVLGETQIVGQMKDAVRAAAGRFARHAAAPDVPAHLRWPGSAVADRHRRAVRVHGRGRRAPGRARVRRPGPGPHAVHRRRRDDRTLRHALRRATPAQHGRGQSHGRARRAAGQSFLGQHHEAVGPDRPLVRNSM